MTGWTSKLAKVQLARPSLQSSLSPVVKSSDGTSFYSA